MLVEAPSSRRQVSHERPPATRPTMDERPGVIEVDLPDGARIRVDALGRRISYLKLPPDPARPRRADVRAARAAAVCYLAI
jgi:hypothetical protein